ncbi:MAG: aminopeptidase P family protein [Pirellulaceae bacterium]
MSDFKARRNQLRACLQADDADAMLVTNTTNVSYLTGFTGDDSFLLVTSGADLLLSDPRYEQQIGEECPGLDTFIREPGELIWDVTCRELAKLQIGVLVVESKSLSVASFDHLASEAQVGELRKASVSVEALREIKDESEIAALRRAIAIAERVFVSVRAQMTSSQTEREIANELERQIRVLGGSGCSFKPIVAVGPRAALPHATPGQSRIGDAPFVLIDWGATFDGYRSDLTRVLATSKIPAKFAEVYQAVLAAQTAAIEAMKPGVLVSEIDAIAREVIAAAGMGEQFNHGLGHGIGLDIHEAPRLGKNQDRPLQPGMVVTVEPGVYYPGWGGVRIEDDCLITADGCEVLSSLPRDIASNCVELLL